MYDDKSYNPPIMFAIEESELQKFRELETKNNLLKVQVESLAIENERLKQENKQVKQQLTEAKDLICNLLQVVACGEGWKHNLDWRVKAEQFLKELENEGI